MTGFSVEDADPASADSAGAALLAASLQLDQRLARDYLGGRENGPPAWRGADAYAAYTLRATPQELSELIDQLDALIRPLIAATRSDAPSDAELVHVGLQAFPRLGRREAAGTAGFAARQRPLWAAHSAQLLVPIQRSAVSDGMNMYSPPAIRLNVVTPLTLLRAGSAGMVNVLLVSS